MSQDDMVVANAAGATVRADINAILQALLSKSSGAATPATPYANMWWWDTTGNLLKIRNGANTAWVIVAEWDGTDWTPRGLNARTISTDAGAASAPQWYMDRDSPSPADNDLLAAARWRGRSGTGVQREFARIIGHALDVTNGAEFGRLFLQTIVNGVITTVLDLRQGVLVGAPTGGDQGLGSLNLAGLPYVNGVGILPGHLQGLDLSNNGADAANDIDIAAGAALSDDGTDFLILAAGVTRQADVAFGTGNGGLSSSLTFTAGVSYHVFLCKDSVGTVTVGFDSSPTAANLIANHSITVPRRIGSRKVLAGPVWQTFYQDGDEVLVDWVQDDANVNPGTSAVLITTSVPTGFKFKWLGAVRGRDGSANSTRYVLVTSPDQTDAVPSVSMASNTFIFHNTTLDFSDFSYSDPVRTNTLGQIRYRLSSSAADVTVRVMTRGWIDRRGRDA